MFVILAPLTLHSVKEVITAAQRDLESPQYLQKYQTDPIFVKPLTLRVRNIEVAGFCYYDLQREQMNGICFISASMTSSRSLSRYGFPDSASRRRCSRSGPGNWRNILRENFREIGYMSRSGTTPSRIGSTGWESRSS